MITTHRLSDAQAAVLSGDVEWNADGSCAVTSGRENTLASLRKLGLLNGNLLTNYGTNARATVQNGDRKIMTNPDKAETFRSPVGEIRTRHAAQREAAEIKAAHAQVIESLPVIKAAIKEAGKIVPSMGAAPVEATPAETLTEITIPRRDVVKGDMMERKNGWTKIASVTTYARTDPRTGITGTERTRIDCGGLSWDVYPADDMITVRRAVAAPVETETADSTHVINFEGSTETLCGEPVRQTSGILRVSVDPSDATCADCIAQEATLAAADAVQPDDDAQDHREAIKAAQAAETAAQTPVELTAAQELSVRAHGIHADALRPGGVVQIPGLPEGTTVPLPPVVVVRKTDGGKLVAEVNGITSTPFSDTPATPVRVAFWAHSVGYRPVGGRRFKWARSGDVLVAPAALI